MEEKAEVNCEVQDNNPKDELSFKLIVSFVNDLNNYFGKRQIGLQLYARLLETRVSTIDDKRKHVHIFADFLKRNEDVLKARNYKLMRDNDYIVFTDKIHIKLKEIFKTADEGTRTIIWKHLLAINTSIYKNDDNVTLFKNFLDENASSNPSDGTDLIKDIFGAISTNIDSVDTSNPISGLFSLLNSGAIQTVFQQLSTKIDNNEIDVRGMMANVTNMMNKLSNGDNPLKIESIEGKESTEKE